MERVVRTKTELKKAQKDNVDKIIVVGKLAKDLQKASAISKMSGTTLAALVAITGAEMALAPVTGGLSVTSGEGAKVALSGLEIAAIIAASSIGLSVIIALFNGYDVKYKNNAYGDLEVEFTKK